MGLQIGENGVYVIYAIFMVFGTLVLTAIVAGIRTPNNK